MILPNESAQTIAEGTSASPCRNSNLDPVTTGEAKQVSGLTETSVQFSRGQQLDLLGHLQINGPILCGSRGKVSAAAMLHVLWAIDDFARGKGVAWPSYKALSNRTKLSLSTVQRALYGLQFLHFISVENGSSKSRWGGRQYRIQWTSILDHSNAIVVTPPASVAALPATVTSPSETIKKRSMKRLPLPPPADGQTTPVSVEEEGEGIQSFSACRLPPLSEWDAVHAQMLSLGVEFPATATRKAIKSGMTADLIATRIAWFQDRRNHWKESQQGRILWAGIANSLPQMSVDRGWIKPDRPFSVRVAVQAKVEPVVQMKGPDWSPPLELQAIPASELERLATLCQHPFSRRAQDLRNRGRDLRTDPMLAPELLRLYRLRNEG